MIMHSDRDWISIAEQVCVEKNSAKLAVLVERLCCALNDRTTAALPLARPTANQMTPEEKIRVRDLPKLIANENDFAKMKVLTIELERLLAKELSCLKKDREAALETDFTKGRGRIQAGKISITRPAS